MTFVLKVLFAAILVVSFPRASAQNSNTSRQPRGENDAFTIRGSPQLPYAKRSAAIQWRLSSVTH
jgi:hypothetical protein